MSPEERKALIQKFEDFLTKLRMEGHQPESVAMMMYEFTKALQEQCNFNIIEYKEIKGNPFINPN